MTHKSTQPAAVGKGRDIALDHASASAIARASEKAGFPIPPTAAAVLAGEPASGKAAKDKPKQAAADVTAKAVRDQIIGAPARPEPAPEPASEPTSEPGADAGSTDQKED